MKDRFLYFIIAGLIISSPLAAQADGDPAYKSLATTAQTSQMKVSTTDTLLEQIPASLQKLNRGSVVSILNYPVKPESRGAGIENVYLSTEVFGSLKRPGAGLSVNVVW
jgi:hypothetical protein